MNNHNYISIIEKSQALAIREKYITSFIDLHSEYYKNKINKLVKCSDGYCYLGYLWDCLKNKAIFNIHDLENLPNFFTTIYIMWDIHSIDKIPQKNYWKYGKNNILKIKFKDFKSVLNTLPEDIYIFDDSFAKSIVLTHEYIGDERYCLLTSNENYYYKMV